MKKSTGLWGQCSTKAFCRNCQSGMGYVESEVTEGGLIRYAEFVDFHVTNCGKDSVNIETPLL